MNMIERILIANTEWLEANKSHADVEAFACVAQATAQLAQIAYGKKETAGGSAVE